jgi:hypothetical protein
VVPELLVVVSPPVVVVVVVDGSTVVVVGRRVVVVGRTVEVVEVVPGLSPAVAAGSRRGLGLVVVEDTPAKRPRFRRVVEDATCRAGASSPAPSSPGAGAVTNPSRLPPPAPSSTATISVAHRRSMLNRTNAPARAFRSDDKRIGIWHPTFSARRSGG